MEYLSFSELMGLLGYLIERQNDAALLEAYRTSYAALQNISFEDFKTRAISKMSGVQETPEETLDRVEQMMSKYEKWEVL